MQITARNAQAKDYIIVIIKSLESIKERNLSKKSIAEGVDSKSIEKSIKVHNSTRQLNSTTTKEYLLAEAK